MGNKRIVAYFMHEDERREAQRLMPQGIATDSYVIGEIDEGELPSLRAKGVVCDEVPPAQRPETPGMIFESRSGGSGFPGLPGLPPAGGLPPVGQSAKPGAPAVYLLQLQGPLLEEWRTRLSTIGVTLLEHVPPDAYTARLTNASLAAVSQESFVEAVTEYGPRETGPSLGLESAAPRPPAAGRNLEMLSFDVRLHEPGDREEVVRWLTDRHVAVAGSSGRKIRFYALETSTIADEVAALAEVAQVERFIPPTLANDIARDLMGIETAAGQAGGGLGLTGQGQIVAVADTGLDATHPDFSGRIVGLVALGRNGDSSDPHGHGTHVAGSVLGDGQSSNGTLRGVAPGAGLFFQSILDAQGRLGGLPLDLATLFEEAYQAGARIHNNSWGAPTASLYTMNASEVDEFVAHRRDMLVVIAAGNDGTSAQPLKAQPGFVDWLSIGSPASAKNALVVGASRSRRSSGGWSTRSYRDVWPTKYPNAPIATATISGDPQGLAAFSGRGPCDDRRIKPDLVAPGTDILSTRSSTAPLQNFWGPDPNSTRYAFMGGTSMATPLVSGMAALVREYLIGRGLTPSAALLKATLINGTRWLSGADAVADHPTCPNYHQGFGCVDLTTTIPHAGQPALRLEAIDNWQTPAQQFTRTGQRQRYTFAVSGTLPLRLCLAWTDLPARGTQNSLALMVQGPNNERWVGNTGLLGALATPDPDNNVHVLRIDAPPPGTYLVQIFVRNLLKGPQDFAFVVNGDLTSALTPVP
jgi:serine protease AprX